MPGESTAFTPDKPGLRARHIPALDGIRGIAVLLILLTHLTLLGETDRFDFKAGRFDQAVQLLAHLGVVGVDLFFVLSGFLITGILYDAKGHDHFFRNFYARRTVRVFPLYYAVVTIAVLVVPMLGATAQQIVGTVDAHSFWYWTYLSNLMPALHIQDSKNMLFVAWSLAIEEQFYLLWPLVVFSFDRRTIMRIAVAMIVLAPIIRTLCFLSIHHLDPTDPRGWQVPRALLFGRMDALAAGAWVVLFMRGPGGIKAILPAARLLLPMGFLAAVAAVVVQKVIFHSHSGFMQGGGYNAIGYTAVALCFAGFIALSVAAGPASLLGRIVGARWLAMFGRYSYGLYLLHVPVVSILQYFYSPRQFPMLLGSRLPGQILFYIIGLAASLGLALISWNLLEKHFLKLKSLFPMDKRDPVRSVALTSIHQLQQSVSS